MPSCAILYYSTTGNTKLACEYIVNRIPQVDFELFDMKDLSSFDPGRYTFIGFATYTDYQAPPKFFVDTISTIGPLNAKDSFIFATYAGLPGKILSGIKKAVEQRGFRVTTGHALPMPENYSPQRKKGIKLENNPNERKLEEFQQFIRDLGDLIVTKELKGSVEPKRIKIGFFNSMIPLKIRSDRLKEMGKKKVEEALCTKCGICYNNCAYGSITLQPGPVFDETKCHACFACYNLCPVGAITSERIPSSEHQYPGPSEALRKRLSF